MVLILAWNRLVGDAGLGGLRRDGREGWAGPPDGIQNDEMFGAADGPAGGVGPVA